jgi:hypothetical protein
MLASLIVESLEQEEDDEVVCDVRSARDGCTDRKANGESNTDSKCGLHIQCALQVDLVLVMLADPEPLGVTDSSSNDVPAVSAAQPSAPSEDG